MTAQDPTPSNQAEAAGIAQPTLKSVVAPQYPAAGVSAGIEGVVIVEATAGASGQVTDARVSRSSRIAFLDAVALDAVRQWEFTDQERSTRFTAVVNFVLSRTPVAEDAPATSVGWPPADFALYYGFECRGPGGQVVWTSRSINASSAFDRIPPATLTADGLQRLSLLLVQEGFFTIRDAVTERQQRASVRVTDNRFEMTVTAKPPHVIVLSDPPRLHHELMVRTYGVWRIVEWTEPVAQGDPRSAEASRVGAAVRRFFRSLEEKGESGTAECR